MTELVHQDDDAGTLEVFPPAQQRHSTAVAMLEDHARHYNTAWKLAGQLVRTSMVPKRFFGKQGDATAAILYGSELGLNPIQALQRVVPIHGMPSLEARTMVGLLKAKGFGFRTVRQSDTVVEVWGWEPTSPRIFGTDPEDKLHYGKRINPDSESTWTIERAKRAGYVPTPKPGVENPNPNNDDDWVSVEKFWDGKKKVSVLGNMKYVTDPQTMLKAKCQAEVSREMAPDVLMGIGYSREDLESEDPRNFDDDRPQRAPANPVTEDEIFAEEVPLDTENTGPATDNPTPAAEQTSAAQETPEADPAPEPPETPAGAVTEDQGDEAQSDPQPAPAAQTEPDPVARAAELAAESAKAAAKVQQDEQAAATSKRVNAKRNTAPAADPDRPKSRMRKALEKRLFALLGDAGYADDDNRDGRLAIYRSVLERDDIASTDDLDDVAVGKVADKLYAWQQQNALVDEVEAIVVAAVASETSAGQPAADPTNEGNE